MKRTLILVLMLSCFFVSTLQGAEKIATSGGRYQLVAGTYTVEDNQADIIRERKGVFRINTVTGETEVCDMSISGYGYPAFFWRRIGKFDEVMDAMESFHKKVQAVENTTTNQKEKNGK